ncbi:tetraacyldisaccharide 4'-kinase [bacterium]|nr:tetraacyldisaccharide 4'-kinase [bacterium]
MMVDIIKTLILVPIYGIFRLIVRIRNFLYDTGLRKSITPDTDARIISIGGISFGGSGKTPMSIYAAKIAVEKYTARQSTAVVSRGYARLSRGFQIVSDGKKLLTDVLDAGDEPYMIAKNIRKAVIAVDVDRIRAVNILSNIFPLKTVILDDCFQHRRIYRDLDIVMVEPDILVDRGRGWFIREKLSALKRADAVVVLDAEEQDRSIIKKNAGRYSQAKFFFGKRKIAGAYYIKDDSKVSIDMLKRKKAAGFCGIAEPQRFYDSLEDLGIHIDELLSFKDHCRYTSSEQEKISRFFVESGAEIMITTEKDAVKLPPILHLLPIYYLAVRIELENEDAFKKMLFPE